MKKMVEEAGAIVTRRGKEGREVLLILSKKNPQVRIFPKGHIEAGESTQDTAARELAEEAGVRARLMGEAGTVVYEFRGKTYRVVYHLFEYIAQCCAAEEGRDPCWFSLEDAAEFLPSVELRDLLLKAACSLQ